MNIEKGIPLPVRSNSKHKYPFDDMEVGDSFYVQGEGRELSRFKAHVSTQNRRLRDDRITGRYFTVRTVEGGVRCWCVPSRAKCDRFRDEDDY